MERYPFLVLPFAEIEIRLGTLMKNRFDSSVDRKYFEKIIFVRFKFFKTLVSENLLRSTRKGTLMLTLLRSRNAASHVSSESLRKRFSLAVVLKNLKRKYFFFVVVWLVNTKKHLTMFFCISADD